MPENVLSCLEQNTSEPIVAKQRLLASILVLIVGACSEPAEDSSAERVNAIASAFVDGYYAQFPEEVYEVGYPDAPLDRFGDHSEQALAEWNARIDDWLAALDQIDVAALQGQQGMTKDGRPSSGDAPLLAEDELAYYAEAYLGPGGTTNDPYAAPLLARDFKGLPPAYVQAVEYDPLRADAEAYAARLEADGVAVDFEVAPGLVHGALRARFVSESAGRAFARICQAARRLLAD